LSAVARVSACCAAAALVVLSCGFTPGPSRSVGAPVIVTAAPAYNPLTALGGGERFPQGAQLLIVRDGKAEPLVAGFFATADAAVSFDATRALFAGKQNASDPWQVWEFTLADKSLRRVTATGTDAIRPLYLPDNHLVYAQRTPQGFQIVAEQLSGSAALPLTYIAASALPVDVLRDGRILFESGFPLGSGSTPELFLVYSDGSGVESYRCDHGAARWGGHQLTSGDVVFTHGVTLARFTSPRATEVRIVAPRAQYSGAIAETASGAWLVSARTAAASHYALMQWQPGAAKLEALLADKSRDIVEPVVVSPRPTPNRHPSGLHDWPTANLLALDARQTREGPVSGTPAAVRLETEGSAGNAVALGTSPVEADGSFFVTTPADRPIRFALLDAHGATIDQERGWFWIRRGEQRICVGCHVGPERAPENQVPAVLMRTTTPVDLSNLQSVGPAHHALPGGN
jgi:hypothetical protein